MTRTCSSTLSIVEQSDHLVPFSEGCLSIPGISCEIERPDHVVVEAYDLDANLIRYELGRPVLRVPAARDRSPARQHHVRATQADAEAQGRQGVPGRPGPRRSTGRDGVGLSVPGAPAYIFPCSNILAALRNCARDEMWALSTGDCVVLARFARVPSGQGWASSLIGALLKELLLLRLFLWFWGIFVLVELLLRMGW